jgi:hypothetical protein
MALVLFRNDCILWAFHDVVEILLWKMIRFFLFFILFCNAFLFSQVDSTVRYNELCFLTTHNAYNSRSESFIFPNQDLGIEEQLKGGVRAFMFDVYERKGKVFQFHRFPILGKSTLQHSFQQINTFLHQNKDEIVTLIFESYISLETLGNELKEAGLDPFIYRKIGLEWSTISEMQKSNQRLIIFTDTKDIDNRFSWHHYLWDHNVETSYSVKKIKHFSLKSNRGKLENDLFILNHFIIRKIGTGNRKKAKKVNTYSFLKNRIEDLATTHNRIPNFVCIDFSSIGDGKRIVEELNGKRLF